MVPTLRPHELSSSQSRPYLDCFCGTFSPFRRQIRSHHCPAGDCLQLSRGALVFYMLAAVVQHFGDHAVEKQTIVSLGDNLDQVVGLYQATTRPPRPDLPRGRSTDPPPLGRCSKGLPLPVPLRCSGPACRRSQAVLGADASAG